MAKQIQEILIDDLTGGEANETVTFGLDNYAYEIDLSSDNAKKLRDALTPFVQHSRRASNAPVVRRRRSTSAMGREKSFEIRKWAKERGLPVSERGRIAATVVEKFEAAH